MGFGGVFFFWRIKKTKSFWKKNLIFWAARIWTLGGIFFPPKDPHQTPKHNPFPDQKNPKKGGPGGKKVYNGTGGGLLEKNFYLF